MEIDSSPEEIDQLQRQVDRLRMEELALGKAKDEATKQRLTRLNILLLSCFLLCHSPAEWSRNCTLIYRRSQKSDLGFSFQHFSL